MGNDTRKNACPYQNKFEEKGQNMSGIVTTAEYNRVVYIFFLIVQLDMLNIDLK